MFPTSLLSHQLEQCREDGELKGCSQFISVPLCCSFPFMLFLYSGVGPSHCGPSQTVKGHFHGLKSSRINLLRHEASMNPDRRTCCCVGFYPWAAVPARSLSTGYKFLQGTSARCRVGSSMSCSVGFCSGVISSTGCRGISVLAPGAPSPSPSSLTLVFAGLFLLLFLAHCPCSILPFLKYVFIEAPPALLMGSAVSCGGSITGLERALPSTGQTMTL